MNTQLVAYMYLIQKPLYTLIYVGMNPFSQIVHLRCLCRHLYWTYAIVRLNIVFTESTIIIKLHLHICFYLKTKAHIADWSTNAARGQMMLLIGRKCCR